MDRSSVRSWLDPRQHRKDGRESEPLREMPDAPSRPARVRRRSRRAARRRGWHRGIARPCASAAPWQLSGWFPIRSCQAFRPRNQYRSIPRLEMDERRAARSKQNVLHHTDQDRVRVERNDVGDAAIERGKRIGEDRRTRHAFFPLAIDEAVFVERGTLCGKTLGQMFMITCQQVHRHAATALYDLKGVSRHIDGSENSRRSQRQGTDCRCREPTALALERARDNRDPPGQEPHGLSECLVSGRHGYPPSLKYNVTQIGLSTNLYPR